MSKIRPLEAGDLEPVARLLDANLTAWGGDRDFLRAWMLDSPWASPELPSLVATDDDTGEPIGFIGVHVKRLRLDDRELTGACCSHLAVDPGQRGGALGALLLGRALRGPQDLSWSDTAIPTVVRMWQALGGQPDNSRVCDWMLVLRPRRWLRSWAAAMASRKGVGVQIAPVRAVTPQGLRGRWPADETLAGISSEPLDAAGILEHGEAALAGRRFAVAYEREYLDYQLGLVAGAEPLASLQPVARLVRRGERPIGWYLYFGRPGDAARALAVNARERDLDAVLADLGREAANRGCTAVAGRLEPHLEQAVRRADAAVGLARQPMIKAADPELLAVLAGDRAVLSQLDGEWWV